MPVACHPTVHEWLIYVVNHPLPWTVGEVSRRLGPVVRVPLLGTLINNADIARVLLHDDERFTKAGPGSVGALVTQVMGPTALINMDGAAHHALREQLRDLFAPSYVDALTKIAMTEPLDSLSRALADGRTVDLVAFMRRLSGRVMCLMLGLDVPPEQAAATYAELHAVGEQLAAQVRFSARPMSPAQVVVARDRLERLTLYARPSYHGASPLPGSIIGRLRDLGLEFDQVKGVLGAILVAGIQTLSVALPRIVAMLLDTGEWVRLADRPELVSAAVDEGLRCCVPIPATIRSVARDTIVHGHRFAAGSRAFVFTYNLAKDPRMFPAPQRFDVMRPVDPRARHLWYGSGPHFCLGFGLAQRELCAVVETLLRTPGRLRVEHRRYARNVLLPGYARLDVRTLPT
jgi:cytochrome P450